MTLVYACVAPHGGELIPKLAGPSLKLFSATRKGMRGLGVQMRRSRPDTIVVASPHNLRLLKHIGIVVSENTSGTLSEGNNQVKMSVPCDTLFGKKVMIEAEKRRLPVVGANYGALEGPASDLAMDWGTLVPLWFLREETHLESKVLVVTPSRGIPLEENVEFGRAIGRVAERDRRRVAFVASADQAHAHRKDGPYGFSPMAHRYDERVLEALQRGDPGRVLKISGRIVEGAKPDSLWQIAILAGLLEVVHMEASVLSYQVPTYYGMLCAGFTRVDTGLPED